jgi:NitT/TauT family transport system substrate-binding protein
MITKKWYHINRSALLLALLLSGLLAACSTSNPEPATVSVRLKWLHQTQFAGIYVAEQEGYYAKEKLTVQIDPIDLNKQVTIEYVLAGEDDIAIGSAEELIIARSQGQPVRAVAVIFRINPLVYVAPQEANIHTPADLVGKTIALSPGQGTYLYEAMMGQLDIDRSRINEIDATSFDVYECWQTADICAHYATNGLARANYEGVPATAIWPNDYGVSFYADVIFTSEAFIQEHPDVVERFVRATLKGWQKAIEDPELATTDTLAFDPELDRGFQLAAMKMSIPLIDTGEDTLGWMRPEIWQQMHDTLLGQGLITAPVDLATVYTNDFVEKAK